MWQPKVSISLDRFIPRRAGENFDISNYWLSNSVIDIKDVTPPSTPKYVNYAHQFFMKRIYIERLWKIIEPMPRKILNFSELNSKDASKNNNQVWPVIPRKKPVIMSPLVILDMPELDTHLCHNVIDWGKEDHIASLYNGEIHIWHPKQAKTTTLACRNEGIKDCIKWDRAGTRLAIAVGNSNIIVVDTLTNEIEFRRICCRKRACTVSSLIWSKDDVLISGCSNGSLTSWFLMTKVGRAVCRAHKRAIIGIQFSCNEKYLASSGLDNTIRIWAWPELEYLLELTLFSPVKAFAWHPWKESLLVCSGGIRPNAIVVWNISICKEICWYICESDTFVDAMTFNKKSGELVVSLYHCSEKRTVVAVFCNFNSLSDAIIWHVGRVPYLLWNGSHTKLLTAGSDENLCVWDFFGNKKKKRTQKSKKTSKFSTNPLMNLNCFGQCIR